MSRNDLLKLTEFDRPLQRWLTHPESRGDVSICWAETPWLTELCTQVRGVRPTDPVAADLTFSPPLPTKPSSRMTDCHCREVPSLRSLKAVAAGLQQEGTPTDPWTASKPDVPGSDQTWYRH